MPNLKEIKDVEIFAAGKWNGDNYSTEDLDEMVRAFNETKDNFRPYLKLGHNNEQELLKNDGLPAAGYVANLKRVGQKLMADFVEIPSKIFELMKRGAYKKRSSEIFWDIGIQDKTFPRMLKAVSLLGAEMPAVSTLDDILNFYGLCENTKITEYQKNINENDNSDINIKEYDFENITTEKNPMDEKKLKELENQKLEAEKKALDNEKKYSAQKDANKKQADEIAALKEEKAKLEADKKDQEIKNFAKDLENEKLCSPAMTPLIEKMIGPEEKNYSVGEKEYNNKKELLKEILKLNSENSNVNLDEDSSEGDENNADKETILHDKVEEYAKENKCDYSTAYRVVSKQLKKEDEE